jgi:PBSX family phage terminase large subunit|uniref:XtmB Phage terminase large subunit n=1 Tax=uncultured Caudovirales phage TaxID=2100421 RepID=A0A6J5KV92_9CAUD|nr:XtmB Phage terminase large subunit [uncultured Caudovirales phage]
MSGLKSISNKQLKSFQESDAKINIWEGSVRSGKTYISLWRFIHELIKGPEGEYVMISRTYDSFKRNILPQLARMIGSDAKYYSGKREMQIWGKTIFIVGADDERAETKIRGSTFSGAYVDEATIIPESVFKMLISRCAMGGARIFATTNPDSPFHWLKRDYLDGNPDVKSWQFGLEDNPKLTELEREYLKRQYKGVWFQRFILGLWVQAEGSVYDCFDDKIHCIDYCAHNPQYRILGVDYGSHNPCAFVLLNINMNKFPNITVEDEYYFDSKVHQRQKTDSEYADDLIAFIRDRSVRNIYIDPSALSFKLELARQGVQNLYEAENEVLDGIRFVSKYLNNGTLKITKNCKNLIKEFHSYVWDSRSAKNGIDKPAKDNDHALDALRYALYTHFFNKNNSSPNPQDWDRYWRDAQGMNPEFPGPFNQPINGAPIHF